MNYDQELAELREALTKLMRDAVNAALSSNLQFEVEKHGLIRPIGNLKGDRLRLLMGKPTITFGAVDGSCSVRRLGGVVFVAAASALLLYELGVSHRVWIEKWPERGVEYSVVLPFLAMEDDNKTIGESPYFDGLAASIMKLLEYFAAHDALKVADVVVVDGSLSTEYRSSVTGALAQKPYRKTRLLGVKTTLGVVDEYDLIVNLHRASDTLSAKPNDAFKLIFEAETKSGVVDLEGADSQTLDGARALAASYPTKILLEGNLLVLSQDAQKSWAKLMEILDSLKSDLAPRGHGKNHEARGLLVEPNTVSLLKAYAYTRLLLEARGTGRLLIGVAKDSSSLSLQDTIKGGEGSATGCPMLPDKLALELYSALGSQRSLCEPWSTVEYDPFQTQSPDAFDTAITGAFLRRYVQLFVEGDVRSDVVVCERLRRNNGDAQSEAQLDADSEYTVMLLLALAQPSNSIPEALGHPYPLFEVDKHVKHMVGELNRLIEGCHTLLLTDPVYSEYTSLFKPFRQKRTEFERGRKTWQRKL